MCKKVVYILIVVKYIVNFIIDYRFNRLMDRNLEEIIK